MFELFASFFAYLIRKESICFWSGPTVKYAQIGEIKEQKYSGSVPAIGKVESHYARCLYVANDKLSF